MKYLYLFGIILSLYFICINAENEIIDKQKILSLKIQSCKEDKDCTGYSNSCIVNEGVCLYTFFCHENSCIIPNTNIKFSFTPEEKATDIILEACTTESHKNGSCLTRSCNENSNCFSNYCVNNTCITNESLPLLQCSNEMNKEKISCGKAAFEKCEKNEDCYYETCNEDKTCNDYKKHNFDKAFSNFLIKYIIIFAIIILIIIILVIIIIKRCNKKS